jgi:hypothetical protein
VGADRVTLGVVVSFSVELIEAIYRASRAGVPSAGSAASTSGL